MAERSLVHLVDGHVWIFRAYFTMPEMLAPDGTHTQAAYGFTSQLLKYLAESQATHVGMCFDHALDSFRNELEPGYKADRVEAPPDLEPQFAMCREAAAALGVATFEMPSYEADDVIATLATQLARRADVRVVTSDKDLSQLVREDGRVVVHDNSKGTTLDADGVRGKFGVDPHQIPDYLGLVGDAIDCLPGVPGVGAKSAAAILGRFPDIDSIPDEPEHWEGVPVRGAAKMALRVAEHRPRALKTRELATVVRDVPGVSAGLRDVKLGRPDASRIEELCDRLGWGRLRDRMLGA
jgi:DNA polymerase-1